jgi:hypothetical protein
MHPLCHAARFNQYRQSRVRVSQPFLEVVTQVGNGLVGGHRDYAVAFFRQMLILRDFKSSPVSSLNALVTLRNNDLV